MEVVSREELADWMVADLVDRIVHLETLLARVMSGQRPLMCGNVLGSDHTVSCQLPTGHDGLHVWATPSTEQIVKWG